MSSLPDEMHMRDLLRPLEGAGRELLRDMGRRTRAYASVLKAWEDLHVVNPSDGTMCARNNILGHHHSRGMKVQTETVLDDASQSRSMAQAVRTYDSYRAFMVRLGQLLFPWTSPHFTDHVALHTSSMGGGRGVVLTAGEDQAHLLLVMVQALSKYYRVCTVLSSYTNITIRGSWLYTTRGNNVLGQFTLTGRRPHGTREARWSGYTRHVTDVQSP